MWGSWSNAAKAVGNCLLSVGSSGATIWDWLENANTVFGAIGGVVALVTGCFGLYYMRIAIDNKKLEKQVNELTRDKLERELNDAG